MDGLYDHIHRLNAFLRTCGECIDDLSLHRQGIPIYYNVDFSLVCPLLFNFDRPPVGSKDFLISERESMRRVLDKRPDDGHYGLVLSGATIIEFFDQLDHTLRDLEDRLPVLQSQLSVKGMRDEAILRKALTTSKEIKRDLSLLTQQGLDARLKGPINRLLGLLDNKKVIGIGDVIDANAIRSRTNKAQFDRFVAEHNAKRHDARSPEDRAFHFKIDAANNCLTVAASQIPGVRAPFVTTTLLNMKQCTIDGQGFARVARTPLFLLNLHYLKQNHEIAMSLIF